MSEDVRKIENNKIDITAIGFVVTILTCVSISGICFQAGNFMGVFTGGAGTCIFVNIYQNYLYKTDFKWSVWKMAAFLMAAFLIIGASW